MSWLDFADLAGKAESLLNNIDQSAAVVISKAATPQKSDSSRKDKESSDYDNIKGPLNSSSLENPQDKPSSNTPKPHRTKSDILRRDNAKLTSPKDSDEALFNFLNNSQKSTKTKPPSTVNKPIRSLQDDNRLQKKNINLALVPHGINKDALSYEMSRNSSYDSLISGTSKTARKISENESISDHPESNSEPDASTFPADSTASESEFEMVASLASKDSDRDSPSSSNQAPGSNIAAENRLLRNELTTLHQELTQTVERNHKIREELQQRNNDLSNRMDDLQEELKVKNTQLAALNMKYVEVEKLFDLEKASTAQLRSENERILRDQSEGSGMHARTIDELRARLNESEAFLAEERQAHSQRRQEILELKNQRDMESRKVVESLQKADMEKHKERQKIEELKTEVRSLSSDLQQTKQEFTDYKQKAARILQSKERLILSLKGHGDTEMTSSMVATVELSEVEHERDSLKEDLQVAKQALVDSRMEFQDVQQQFQQDQSMLQQEINGLRRELDMEVRGRQEVELELRKLEDEGRREREELVRSRTSNQSRLRDKDVEIERLRNQLKLRSQSTPQESELESRLKKVTEIVIQKQSLVETLSAEKSSLSLQLERLQGQVNRLSQNGGNAHINLKIGDVDPRSSSSNNLFSHDPQRGVVGRVKKVASVLDQFSIRLGVFLKRYPPARLFVLIYMGFLHFWVMIVLLTYTPEAHDEEYLKSLKHDGHL